MNVVGRVGSVISQGVYSVATPFHPFGGAVDIIAVEQPDGSYRTTPWYVRFGKFQGVLKGAEKVVTITVNGVEANFHMQLDNSGQAYFMRELVPGSQDSGTSSEEEAVNEPEPPARSKSDGDLYIGPSDRLGSQELDVEHQEKQTRDEFESYDGYGRLEESEDLPTQADGGNSEVVLVSVDGHVLTAPISSTEEGMEDVQLSDPQFHLGPGQSSSGDFTRSGEVWDAGIDDLYISQEKVKFNSGHQSEVLIENGEVPVEKDESHHISIDKDEAHVSTNDDEAHAVSTNDDEAHAVSTNEDDEVQDVSKSRNSDMVCQTMTSEGESHDILGDIDVGYQTLTREDDSPGVSGDNVVGYQPLTYEHKAHDTLENNDEDQPPLTNEDESCDVPVLEKAKDCNSPTNKDEVCDLNNEDTELEDTGASFGKNDTFQSCLDLTSQIDDGDSGNELFSPGSDYQRDSELTLGNCSVAETDLEEGETKTAYCGQYGPLQEGVDVSTFTSEVDKIQNKESSSPEGGSHGRDKEIASEIEAAGSDGLQSSMATSGKDKLGSIPEHPEVEEQNKEEHSQSQKGLEVEISLCGNMLRPGMGRKSAEEAFQQHLVHEEDFKSSGSTIIKNANLIVKVDNNYFPWSKVSHVILGKAVFGSKLSIEPTDAIPVEHQETPKSREDSLRMSPSSRRWRLWINPFRITRSLQCSNSDSSEDIFLDSESVLSPMDEQTLENSKNQSPRKQFVRTLIPTSEQVASLNLKEGQNLVTFSFSTRVLGKQQVDAHIYLWKWNAKIVISDVDGTITRSDVLGQVMPLVGRDWSHSGVARLFSAIKENGYQLLFLSARAIVQAYLTKNFLFNLKQDGKALPNGPVVISPDGLFPSLYREVIRRAPHEFKIACLEDIKALFPSDYNPFYAGFGNRDTDELSYKKMGIPKGKIFIINPKGEVAVSSSVDVKSYTSLHTLVNDMFPPTTLVEQAISILQGVVDSGSVSMYDWNMSEDTEPGGDFMSPPSSTMSVREDVEMQESPTEINRSFKAIGGANPSSFIKKKQVVQGGRCRRHWRRDANLPSGSKVTTNQSGGTMETPVSSSLGAMGPLLRKVFLLLTPKYPLRRSVKHAIQLLKEDLEDINDALVEQAMVDSPNNKGKYWMHEARELSYDVEGVIDALLLPHSTADEKVRVRSVHGHRVGRLKIKGLPNMLKPLTRISRVTELRTLLWEASERHQRYELDVCISNPSFLFSGHSSRIPVPHEVAGNLVGIDAPKNELTTWLTARAEQLKVLCIVGPAGVGKTALAKELYRELGSQFECKAFVRVTRTPHMSRLLLGILSQIQRPKQNSDTCSVPYIIDEIRKHLQEKRYFIVIDGLWEARVWDIIKSAFPKGHNCSRIMITCEVKDVATKFCSYESIDVFELKPLGSQDSEKLFFDTMSGSNVQCHEQLKEVSCRILRECAGVPLATIAIASLLASQPDNSDLWHHLLQYFLSDLANLTLDELLKGTVNLCYNILPQDLKTCLLYLSMYPEGCTIMKVDLLKQWIAEGFITATTKGKEAVAENYFAELVNRGMIQPEKIMHNDEVLSCTVHHIVFDLIMQKSREENFTTTVDYSQTVTEFFMKVYRLSLHFSCAQYATKLEGIRLSQIRSLSFFGLLRCLPSVAQLRLLRVLILEFWDDNDECISLNLSRISGLVLLRYLKISSHLLVELPSKIQELKFLETLEIDARVWSVPDDIVHLPGLLHLSIQDEAKLPEGIGRVTSLQTLQYFDLGNNSEDNVRSLCELINLRDLHTTCSTALSDAHLKRKFVVLAASLLKLTNLRSLTVAPGAISTPMFVDYSSAMLSTPMFLQRLEMLPPICIFSRLPEWVGKLNNLRILKIVVRVLLSSDIDVLSGLPGLTVLSLYIRQPNTQRVVFSSGALPVLKYFKYTCGALFLAFQEEALPKLERLKLRFNVHKDEMYYHMNSGLENLLNLKEMTVKIGAADGAKESDKKAAESALESALCKHPRFPIHMNVRRIDWVEEE